MHQVELQIKVLSINGVLGGCVVVKLEGGVDIEGYFLGICFLGCLSDVVDIFSLHF